MNAYATLLASSDVRRLVFASMIGRLPTAMLPLALILLVVETGGSLATAGLVAAAFGVGRSVVSPSVGALIDRVGQPRVLIGGSVIQALLLITLVAAAGRISPFAVGAIAAAAGAASPPLQASLRALWPSVTEPGQQDTAYSFDATSQELVWVAGPLVVGLIVAAGSATAAVIASAALGCAGVGLFATSNASRRAGRRSDDARTGALKVRGLPALIGASAATGFAWGALSFGLAALAVQLGQRQLSGVLLAAVSAGSIAGGLAYGAWSWRAPVIDRFRALLIACAALAAPLLLVRSIGVAIPASIVAGLPLAPMYGASYVLTGRIVPRRVATEAFTWTSSAFALGVAFGTGASGIAAVSGGVGAAFGLACLSPLVAWSLSRFIGDGRAVAERAQAR